ncbi:uncharacterized protein LOC109709583 [Ananas comosus]|uniref:Uncharacterized protein LOC109709583 n=1 Tax=Ananas comosus TaxID=4615 RepID=A0A6P5F2A5_ANACO|nr:uncharacterized protein LOC109709583 [Ananas comosus]
MAKIDASPNSTVSIGNCKVEILGDCVICQSNEKSLTVSVSNDAKIRVSVEESGRYNTRNSKRNLKSLGEECSAMVNYSFFIINPKDVDNQIKSLLQEVLKLYMQELPTMNYAANTGKNSRFLERSITNGKYTTLILRSNSTKGFGEVIAAVSYQIIPADAQHAEIPLAAVSSKYQKKGIGQLLFKELSGRLQSVGVSTIFCWADKVSEGFWLKQGFVPIGAVDSKGKVRRLPIKAEIRRALCFPGDSTLMVAHLKKELLNSLNPSQTVQLPCSKPHANSSGIPPCSSPFPHPDLQNNEYCESKEELEVVQSGYDPNSRKCSSRQRLKRHFCEASSSSLKSKRVRGGHDNIDCCQVSITDLVCDSFSRRNAKGTHSVHTTPDYLGAHAEGNRTGNIIDHLFSKGRCPKIMFMNIADDAKKSSLTKIVEKLGGSVSSEGSASTHVITGKARRTMNFCVALCSGAWIVSPNWLKESFKEGRFVEESEYILKDEEYLTKYKCELGDAVARAKANPCSLFMGCSICLSKHIQPSFDDLSIIIKSAGGNVIRRLADSQDPWKTIFVACEEDMADALAAARNGAWIFNSEWLISCVMKQELDLEAPQFAESL